MLKITAQRVKLLRLRTGAGVMDCKRALIESADDLDAAADILETKRLTAPKIEHRPTPQGLVAHHIEGRRGVLIELAAETDFVSRNAEFRNAAATLARISFAAGCDREQTLVAASPDGRGDVGDYIGRLAARFGENIVLRRVAGLESERGVIGAYAHGSPEPGLGRMVALAAVSGSAGDGDVADFARKLAMHVVAAAPLWTTLEDVPAAVKTQKGLQTPSDDGAASAFDRMIEGRLERFYQLTVLMRQRYILASEMTVAQALAAAAGGDARIDGFACFRVGEDPSHELRVAQAAEFEWTFGHDWSGETPAEFADFGDIRVFRVSPTGPRLRDDRDAVDLINAAWNHGVRFIALPIERLGDDFFPLSTRKAGDILQKFSNFGAQIAIMGDLSSEIAQSTALRDFIYESNSRDQVWFTRDWESLKARLAGG